MASHAIAAALAALVTASVAPPEPTVLPVDGETVVAGIPTGCTGIGETKNDPKWAAYPVRIELPNAAREYLRDGEATIFDAPACVLLGLRCASPWIPSKLPIDPYRAEALSHTSLTKARA